jgi:Chaperone of endosialidase
MKLRPIHLPLLAITGILFSAMVAQAWTGPSATAPNNNVAAPVNVGATTQTKSGLLGVNSLSVFGNTLLAANGYINWGTISGTAGYGFRDNTGIIEFKNSSGSWQSFQSFVSSLAGNPTASVAFRAWRNAVSQTIPAGTWTLVDLTVEEFDTANSFNPTTDRFQPTVAGKYVVTANTHCAGSATQCYVGLQKNGSWFAISYVPAYGYAGTASQVIDLNGTSDYVTMHAYSVGGTVLDGQIYTTVFSGALIVPVNSLSVTGSAAGTANYVSKFLSGTTLGNSQIFDNGSNVGVGTVSPVSKLTIAGEAGITGGWAGGGNVNGLFLGFGNPANVGTIYSIQNGVAWRQLNIDGTPLVLNSSSGGNVGIGMVPNGPKLHVAGSIGATDWVGAGCEAGCESGGGYALMYANGTSVITSTANAAAFIYNSDRRLKENIKPIGNALWKLLQIEGVEFEWSKDNLGHKKGEHDIGVIAQDVEKVLPEAVRQGPDSDYKAVDYPRLIPLLIGAIKEQQEKIDSLEKRLELLENKI